ncbi:MAG: multicopper oxidase domain-containing protein [Deltaproteobacteria bacterium]|nr:multicopper oxidase domain-containing protein [Deltaproteobacteria bacterium]
MKRRELFRLGAVAGGAALLRPKTAAASQVDAAGRGWERAYSGAGKTDKPLPPGIPGRDYQPVVVPGGGTLPWKIVDGVKVYHLVVGEVEHEFAPGLKAKCWGYNGFVNGPVIEGVEGERFRMYVTNKLPVKAGTTVHPHGVFLPSGMDGVGGLSQRAIQPGETFKYEWTWKQYGTLMYHSHHDEMTQMQMGLIGMFVIHPRRPAAGYRVDRDFALLMSEWSIPAGANRPNPNEMTDFNILTFNGKAFPGTKPLICKKGDRVRIRLGNLSTMSHHAIHIHGHYFKVTATDGGDIPVAGQWPETTTIVPTGSVREIELVTDAPGDWAFHCHMLHHVMNQMGHGAGNMLGVDAKEIDRRVRKMLPSYMTMGPDGMGEHGEHIAGGMPVPANSIPMVGARGPKDYITMGGMATIVKVREDLKSYDEDPGYYKDPPGTVADLASPAEMKRDGINV